MTNTFTLEAYNGEMIGKTIDEVIKLYTDDFLDAGLPMSKYVSGYFPQDLFERGWSKIDDYNKSLLQPLYDKHHTNLSITENTTLQEWGEINVLTSVCAWYGFRP